MRCRKGFCASWLADRPAVIGFRTLAQQTDHFFAATETINIYIMMM